MKLVKILILLIFLFCCEFGLSDDSITNLISSTSFETSKKVNNITTNEQGAPSIILDKDGNIYITWTNVISLTDTDIYFSKSTDKGLSFTDTVRVNDVTLGVQGVSRIAVGKDGTIYVVWSDARTIISSDIYLSKSTDGGKTFSTSVRVNDTTGGTQAFQDIAIDGSGNIYVVWHDSRSGTNNIYFSKSTDGGATFSTSKRVDDSTTRNQYFPVIVLDGNRNIYVSWLDNRNGTNVYDIYFSKSEDGGSTFKTNVKVGQISSNLTSIPNQGPSLTLGLNEKKTGYNVYIVFEVKASGGGPGDIYLAKSTDGGITFSSSVKVNDVISDDQGSPKIDVDGRGDVYVIWQDKRNGADYDVYFSKSTDTGSTFSSSIRVNDITTSDQGNFSPLGLSNIWTNLSLAVDGEGNIFTGWNDKRSGDFDIYFARGVVSYSKTNLDKVVSYPNPLIYSSSGSKTIIFVGLTDDASLRIYNVAGELIRELNDNVSNGKLTWDVKNKDGEVVASGVYIYVITNPKGDKKLGKVAIIK